MMQNEFEKLLGRAVSPQVFDAANRMYMECSLSHEEFVEEYTKHDLINSQVVAGLLESVQTCLYRIERLNSNIKNISEALAIKNEELAEFLIQQDLLANNDSLRTKAIELIGEKAYIKTKIAMGYVLTPEDSEIVNNLLK